jgi:hypothetical protein
MHKAMMLMAPIEAQPNELLRSTEILLSAMPNQPHHIENYHEI